MDPWGHHRPIGTPRTPLQRSIPRSPIEPRGLKSLLTPGSSRAGWGGGGGVGEGLWGRSDLSPLAPGPARWSFAGRPPSAPGISITKRGAITQSGGEAEGGDGEPRSAMGHGRGGGAGGALGPSRGCHVGCPTRPPPHPQIKVVVSGGMVVRQWGGAGRAVGVLGGNWEALRGLWGGIGGGMGRCWGLWGTGGL